MARHDSAWFDAQYNNRARVHEHPEILARWSRASALSRDSLSRRIDVAYGSGPAEKLDIFPTTSANAPVLVFIHGGWWRTLDKSEQSFIAPAFVHAGAMVVLPNYDLCPKVGIDDIAMQMVRALAWIWRNAALYGGDPNRIVVAGHSAGGHLASMVLCCDWKAVGNDLPKELGRLRPGALAPHYLPATGPAPHARVGSPPEPCRLRRSTWHALRGGRCRRERRVLAEQRAHSIAMGTQDRAGQRSLARVESFQRASRPCRTRHSLAFACKGIARPSLSGQAQGQMRTTIVKVHLIVRINGPH